MGKKIEKYFRKKYSQQYQEYSQCLFSTSSFIQKTKTNETKKQNKNLLNVNNTICKQEKYFFSPKNNFPIFRFKIKIFKKKILLRFRKISISIIIMIMKDYEGIYFISYLFISRICICKQPFRIIHTQWIILVVLFRVVVELRMFNKQQRFCSSLIQPNK